MLYPASSGSALASQAIYFNLLSIWYVDIDGNIQQFTYGNGWQHQNLTTLANAPAAAPNSPLAIAFWSIQYLDENGNVQQLTYDSGWQNNNLTSLAAAPIAGPGSPLTSAVTNDGMMSIEYLDVNNNVQQLIYDSGWQNNNLTSLAAAPTAAPNSPLTSALTSDGLMSIEYLDENGNVQQLIYDSGWQNNNLTSLAAAPTAAPTSPLTSALTNDGLMSIEYLDENNNVQQLIYDSGWQNNNLTSLAAAPTAAPNSPLTSSAIVGGTLTIEYLDDNNNVQQLFYSGAWHHHNMSDIPIPTETNSWMKAIPDEQMISQFTIPGTHDSATYNAYWYQLYGCTQNFSIKDQLNIGCRFLDIRLKLESGSFECYHGIWDMHLNFEDIAEVCEDFLNQNPNECILMSVKNEGENVKDFNDQFFSLINLKYSNLFYVGNEIPTIGNVRKKIVLIRRFGLPSTLTYYGLDFTEIPGNSSGHFELNQTQTAYVEDLYSPPRSNSQKIKQNAIAANIALARKNSSPDNMYLTFTSWTLEPWTPRGLALPTNSWLISTVFNGVQSTLNSGIVAMDAVSPELVSAVLSNYVSNPLVDPEHAAAAKT